MIILKSCFFGFLIAFCLINILVFIIALFLGDAGGWLAFVENQPLFFMIPPRRRVKGLGSNPFFRLQIIASL